MARIGFAVAAIAWAAQAASAPLSVPPATETSAFEAGVQRPVQAPPPPGATAGVATRASSASGDVKPVALSRVVIKMEAGTPYVTLLAGRDCKPSRTASWNGGAADQKLPAYLDPFRDALQGAGYKIEGDSSNLFEGVSGDTTAAEFSVGALITGLEIHACVVAAAGATPASVSRASEGMAVEWQVFSRLSRQVVARIDTSADYVLPDGPSEGSAARMAAGAFKANAVKLAASEDFRRAVMGRAAASGQLVRPVAGLAPIGLPGEAQAPIRPVNASAAAVAVVFAGDGEGSGFLVSRDGYVLTDAHVVGGAQDVRLRWADGREELGSVVRVARERDVALIKTDAQGRAPLPLRRDTPGVGETVFAIGAPLGQRYQGTVTRGVVSARRVFDGYAFIQSDITVNPGGSGGPLLDEQGRVVGMTRSGVRLGTAPTGINLFIPAGSAMDFLALEPR